MKREDDIMAQYLLKGGKMLSKSCPSCGCPLFEYRGETLCVVCRGEQDGELPDTPLVSGPEGTGRGFVETSEAGSTELASTLTETLMALCIRIRDEKNTGEVQALMSAVKTGAEVLRLLR